MTLFRAIIVGLSLIALTIIGEGSAQAQVSGCPIGSTTRLGCYKVDGITITVNGGIISSVGGGGGGPTGPAGGALSGTYPNPNFAPLPFFGSVTPPWVRPTLSIGGAATHFNIWLNKGPAIGIGLSTDSPPYSSGNPVTPGTGYVPGDTVRIAGGTLNLTGIPTPAATVLTITDTQVAILPTIVAPGTGGTPGAAQVIGTTGAGPQLFILNVTIGVGGGITSIDSIANAGDYTTNPTVLAVEPVADNSSSGITGASVDLTGTIGALVGQLEAFGNYATPPTNPVSQTSTSGSGTGATWNLAFSFAGATDGSAGNPLIIDAGSLSEGLIGAIAVHTALLKPITAAPWTITVAHAMEAGVGPGAGPNYTGQNMMTPIILYNSANDRAIVIAAGFSDGPFVWKVLEIQNISTPSATTFSLSGWVGYVYSPYFTWWRVSNDGTNLTFNLSGEGSNFMTHPPHIETLASFIGNVTHVGYGLNISNNYEGLSILWNWEQTSP